MNNPDDLAVHTALPHLDEQSGSERIGLLWKATDPSTSSG